jgi:trans-2,3-dihydro-3-hydroxyanthranilate isomerase
MPRPFHICDVFTNRPYAGNPLAIVEDADSLTAAQMQAIARQFNLSETIFIQRPADPAHDAKVRIFLPTAEIPFAGHPTIGCAIHLASRRAGHGDLATEIVLEEQAGLVPVTVTRTGSTLHAEFTAPVLPHPHDGQIDTGSLAPALGLDAGEIGFAAHRPGLWAGGPAFLYVPLANRTALSLARPMEPHWSRVMDAAGLWGAYVYTASGSGCYAARMFAPTAGVPEDPATGAASAILAAQLLASGALAEGTSRIALTQGEDMGRPSAIAVAITVGMGALQQVKVGGAACPVASGTLTALPPA